MLAVVCAVAFLASGLTLFSGFGLGTILLPAFSLFFPVEAAVGMTAVVHLANNLFKLVLLGRRADRGVVLAFGLPAVAAAVAGARLLLALGGAAPRVIGVVMIAFAALEAVPSLRDMEFSRRWLPAGGALSGFFGGLSGHQGALRSAFLARAGLSKEAFIGTGVVIACLVDLTRLGVYSARFSSVGPGAHAGPVAAATASAFLGAWLGARFMDKVTLEGVRRLVAVMLVAVGLALAAGVLR